MQKLTFAVATIAALTFSGAVFAGPNDPAPVPAPAQTHFKAHVGAPHHKMVVHRSVKPAGLTTRRHVRLSSRHDRGLHKGFSHSRHLGYAKAGSHDIKMGLKVKTGAKTKAHVNANAKAK